MGPAGLESVAIVRHPAGVELNPALNSASPSAKDGLMGADVEHARCTRVALCACDIEEAKELAQEHAMARWAGPTEDSEGARGPLYRAPNRNVVEPLQQV